MSFEEINIVNEWDMPLIALLESVYSQGLLDGKDNYDSMKRLKIKMNNPRSVNEVFKLLPDALKEWAKHENIIYNQVNREPK